MKPLQTGNGTLGENHVSPRPLMPIKSFLGNSDLFSMRNLYELNYGMFRYEILMNRNSSWYKSDQVKN